MMKRKILILFSLLTFAFTIFADTQKPKIIPPYDMQNYNAEIQHIYNSILKNKAPLNLRVDEATHYFLGHDYVLGTMGEGPTGEFDQMPLYRTDVFDCTTYVEITLALAEAQNLNQFEKIIKQIRYRNANVFYIDRNHFAGLDWDKNNQKAGFIKDITAQVDPQFQMAKALIDKPNWYKNKTYKNLQLLHPLSSTDAAVLLNKLQGLSTQFTAVDDTIPFVPLAHLFYAQNGRLIPHQEIFDRIPDGSIVEIVQSNYNLTPKIGTNLNVRHLGWAIHSNHGLMFREASSIYDKVVDVPLADYLSHYYNSHNPLKFGINIQLPLTVN